MPHIEIFMQKKATEDLLSHNNEGYVTSDDLYVDVFVAKTVLDSFHTFGLELEKDQVIPYDLRVTNSMPVDMSVNITVWYTPERAPHLEAIRKEVLSKLRAWAPDLKIEVHLVVVGIPDYSGLQRLGEEYIFPGQVS